jgi:hypothetical protein
VSIAGINVDTRGAGDIGGFQPIPACKPESLIQGYEIKDKNGAKAIDFAFLITAGPHKDRKLFESATIFDPRPGSKAVGYGLSFLKSLGKALGYPEGPWDDAMLNGTRGKRVVLDVTYENERFDANTQKTYPPRNRIVGIDPMGNGLQAGVQMQPPQNMQPQQYAMSASAPQQLAPQSPQQYAQQPANAYTSNPAQPPYAPQQTAPAFQQQPLPTSLPPQANYGNTAPQPAPQQAAGQPTWMTAANA